jgi:DNA-binding transcriptional LysR family regulator
MEFRHLKCFMSVNEHKSFTKAAGELHITQPAVTSIIKAMEAELGTGLYVRGPGRLTLTQAGEVLARHASVIMEDMSAMETELKELVQQQNRHVNICVSSISGINAVPVIIDGYLSSHPQAVISLRDEYSISSIHAVSSGSCDLAVATVSTLDDPALAYEMLYKCQVYVLMSKRHPLSRRKFFRLSDLENEEIILFQNGTTYAEECVCGACAENGIRLNIKFRVTSPNTMFYVVEKGYGISFIINDAQITNNSYPGLVTIPFEIPFYQDVGIIWKKNHLTTAASELLLYIRNYFQHD